jgi:hypothetical protein
MDDEAIANVRLEILRMMMENGSALTQADPLPLADKWFEWVIAKGHKSEKTAPKNKAA